ncbi:quercetin dioxygenase-like cupin family protein [Thermobifida halotolerans]|nr:quercetin 2,3-dioxygenase [Thermobifida halotolerans]
MSVPEGAGDPITEPEVLYRPRGRGRMVWLNGDVYTVKIGGGESRGAMALVEASVPPGGGPPLHTHDVEDEAFYVVDGELEIYAGERTFHARAGDFVFIPRGTVHGFRNTGTHPARQLLIFTPGGYEHFFSEAGRPVVAGQPAPPRDPADDARVNAVGEKYGSVQLQFADGTAFDEGARERSGTGQGGRT